MYETEIGIVSVRDYGESFTTACKGGLTRSSVSVSPSLPDFLSASDAWTHSPSIVLLVSSICLKSGREGDSGRSQGCSSRALNVGRFRGILFKLGLALTYKLRGKEQGRTRSKQELEIKEVAEKRTIRQDNKNALGIWDARRSSPLPNKTLCNLRKLLWQRRRLSINNRTQLRKNRIIRLRRIRINSLCNF